MRVCAGNEHVDKVRGNGGNCWKGVVVDVKECGEGLAPFPAAARVVVFFSMCLDNIG